MSRRGEDGLTSDRRGAADILVLGGTVLTMDAAGTLIVRGGVAIRDGRILEVGRGALLKSRYRARRVLDAEDNLVLPGLVNAHTHVAMTLFRGVRDDEDLITWLTKYMFPLEARFVSADFVRVGALLGCWEMIASGTTTFADGFFFEEEVAKAADEAGLRALPGQGIFDVPVPDAPDADAGLRRAEKYLSDWAGHPRITPALAPHAGYTVGPETFRRVGELAGRFGAPVFTHLAESDGELAMMRERYGTTPVRHLAAIGALDSKLTAAHCVRVDEEEVALLARSGAGVAHCPESNMKLASGVAPIGALIAAGIPIGLGTDGPASNNDLDLFSEMDTAAKLQKVARLDPTAAPAREIVRMATSGGAAALQMAGEIGSLEPGKRADLIVVRADGPNALPLYDAYSYLVYSARADAVDTVIVEGKPLMERRRLTTLDTGAIAARARAFGRRIAAALPE